MPTVTPLAGPGAYRINLTAAEETLLSRTSTRTTLAKEVLLLRIIEQRLGQFQVDDEIAIRGRVIRKARREADLQKLRDAEAALDA